MTDWLIWFDLWKATNLAGRCYSPHSTIRSLGIYSGEPPSSRRQSTQSNINEHNFPHRHKYPYLMLSGESWEITSEERDFFPLSNNINAETRTLNVRLAEAWNRQCLSSRDWLLTVSEDSTAMLVNPFRRRKIMLPKLNTIPGYQDYPWNKFAKKFALSADLMRYEYRPSIVIACRGCSLGFCKPGDDNWSYVKDSVNGAILDVTYHKGFFYAFDSNYTILTQKNRTTMEVVSKMPEHYMNPQGWIGMGYILGLREKLLVVIRKGKYDEWIANGGSARDFPGKDYGTVSFDVYEFNLTTRRWLDVHDLRNIALFLGPNSSFWMEASDDGCIKANCIYFADNVTNELVHKKGGSDMGIYHLSDGRIEPHFPGESLSNHSPPMWLQPSSKY